MKVRCPNCGIIHKVEEPKTYTFESSRKMPNVAMAPPMQPPASLLRGETQAGPPPGGFSARRETPAYQPTFEANISIPFRQSVIFGLFKAPVGGLVAWGLAYLVDTASTQLNLTTWGYIVATGAGMLVTGFWVAAQKWEMRLDFYDSLLWKVEEASQRDIDGDGQIGQPEAPHRVEVELRKNGKPWKFESLEISQDRLIKLARAVSNGQPFTNRTAADCKIPREEFNELRDKFVGRGWAEWRGEPGSTQGVRLTDEGLDIIGEIATTPLPRSQRGYENSVGSTHPPKPTQGLSGRYEHIEE